MMVASLFCFGLLLYYLIVFKGRLSRSSELATILWVTYFVLSLSAIVISATDVIVPKYPPNYFAGLYLLACVTIGVSGFLSFRASEIRTVLVTPIRAQTLLEGFLVGVQIYATVFFLPFAIASMMGDANENRLSLADKMQVMSSYGLFNTVAGAASHLSVPSLVLAFIRLAQPKGRGHSVPRAVILTMASLSYVIYVLAYVGRDGVVYWLMTALALFVVFRPHMGRRLRAQVLAVGMTLAVVMLFPFLVITVARFTNWEHGTAWSILEYFGRQISTFSDYSSIERPLTLGTLTLPMFVTAGCSLVGLQCEAWVDLKPFVFDIYLAQGVEPWLFGTYVADFVGDFGLWGAFVFLSLFALVCYRVCRRGGKARPMTLSRLLLIIFLFLVPYWGVFYFRFSIINGFIVVNLALVFAVWLLQRIPMRLGVAQCRTTNRRQRKNDAAAEAL